MLRFFILNQEHATVRVVEKSQKVVRDGMPNCKDFKVRTTFHLNVRRLAKSLPPIQRFKILYRKSYHKVYSEHF